MLFNSHGKIDLYWEDTCLIVQPMGSINEEGAKGFNKKIEHAVLQKKLQQWSRIEYFTESETFGTPESYILLRESIIFSFANGCTNILVVGVSSLNQTIFQQISEDLSIPLHLFDTLDEALSFVADY